MAKTATIDIGKKSIDPEVCDIIKRGTWIEDGFAFVMPRMDRKLYAKVKKVIEALGGKWNRKAQATLFQDMDDVQSLLEAVETGVYVDLKKAFQQFDTPDEIAELMLDELRLQGQECLTFLEPSAGTGQLIRAVSRACDGRRMQNAELTAVELDKARAIALRKDMTGSEYQVCKRVLCEDFLLLNSTGIGRVDRVIMNPPFTRSQDIDHVMRARNFLKPGGILVAIMSPGFTFREDNKAKLFRNIVEHNGSYVPLPDGAFKTSGTNVRTVMVTLRKPA